MIFERIQNFLRSGNKSLFLWGATQTGKSTLIKTLFPDSLNFDLLESDVYQTLLMRPQALREIINAQSCKYYSY